MDVRISKLPDILQLGQPPGLPLLAPPGTFKDQAIGDFVGRKTESVLPFVPGDFHDGAEPDHQNSSAPGALMPEGSKAHPAAG